MNLIVTHLILILSAFNIISHLKETNTASLCLSICHVRNAGVRLTEDLRFQLGIFKLDSFLSTAQEIPRFSRLC